MTERGPRAPRWHWLVLAAAAVAVFWPALLGDYVYDDELLIVRNTALQQGNLGAQLTQPLYDAAVPFWRPLTSLLLCCGHHLGGAVAIHALSLALHVACAWLVFGLARRLVSVERALWVALLFVIHPVQVESVAWCAALNDPLWVLFALLAMHAAVRWRDGGGNGLPWQSAAWVFVAMLSKESGVAAAPLVLAALAWISPRQGAKPTNVRWRLWLALLAGVVVLWFIARLALLVPSPAPATAEGVVVLLADRSEPFDPLSALRLLAHHLELLVLPLPTTPFRSVPEASAGWLTAATVLLVALAALLWRTWRSRAEHRMVPALLLLPIALPVLFSDFVGTHPINDRYLYATVAGLGLLLVGWLPWRRAQWLPWVLLVPLGALTFSLSGNWRNAETLSSYTVEHHPNDPEANVMAGDAAFRRAQTALQNGEYDRESWARAKAYYHRAEANSGAARSGMARVTLSASRLGLAWCLMNEPQNPRVPPSRLVAAFQAAVEVGENNAAAWTGLGVANGMAGNPTAAETALRRALDIDPDRTEAWHNLGFLQLQLRQVENARKSFEQALRCNPGYGPSRAMLEQLGGR